MCIIEIKDIEHQYGQEKVLKGISLCIDRGEYLAIIGKSGSGKTTLLNIAGGMLEPTHGHVYIDHQDIFSMSQKDRKIFMRDRVACIFQDYHLIEEFTVYENIQLPFFIKKENYDQQYFHELLKLMDIEDIFDKFPEQLSGGQKQRVCAMRAILQKPDILLCDEPTGNLDQKNSQELIQILKNCHSKFHQTILLVTHDLDIARSMNRMIRIKDGIIDFDQAGDQDV